MLSHKSQLKTTDDGYEHYGYVTIRYALLQIYTRNFGGWLGVSSRLLPSNIYRTFSNVEKMFAETSC